MLRNNSYLQMSDIQGTEESDYEIDILRCHKYEYYKENSECKLDMPLWHSSEANVVDMCDNYREYQYVNELWKCAEESNTTESNDLTSDDSAEEPALLTKLSNVIHTDSRKMLQETPYMQREGRLRNSNCSIVGVVYKSWYLERATSHENVLSKMPVYGGQTLLGAVDKRSEQSKLVLDLVGERFQTPQSNRKIREEITLPSMKSNQDVSVGTSDLTQLMSFVQDQSTIADNYVKTSKLLEEANIQSAIMLQATKALRLATSGSIEEVECQRILLVTELKRQAILSEMVNTSFTQSLSDNSTMMLKIRNISLPQKLFMRASTNKKNDYVNYYVCILTSGTSVYSTKITKDNETIVFNDTIAIDEIMSNGSINVAVYQLSIKEKVGTNQRESKWKKFKKLFKTATGSRDSSYEFSTTKFNLVGKCDLNKHNMIANNGNFKLTNIPAVSRLDGRIVFDYDLYY